MENVEVKVLPEGEELTIRTGTAGKIFQYNGFNHEVFSTESLITLTKAKGKNDSAIVAYCESGVQVILDDTVTDRDQDRIKYDFKTSQQFAEWEKILRGTVMGQKQLIDFLRRREEGEVDDIDFLISQVQQFKYVTNISGDFTYDDRNNYTFAIKVGEAEGTVRLPQIIIANIEIYNESGFIQPMEIEVEVQKPKSEDEKLLFGLSCPKFSRYQKKALENEINQIKQGLDGFLIITGDI
jgi:hypothetical protein